MESALFVLIALAKGGKEEGAKQGKKKGMTMLPSLSKRQYDIYGEAKTVGSKLSPIRSQFIRLPCCSFPRDA